jgi:hypothetical protein
MKKLVLALAGAALIASGSVAIADMAHHPHLKVAHDNILGALEHLKAANDGTKQFGGHRERAEQLCHEAEQEINEAVNYADSHKK